MDKRILILGGKSKSTDYIVNGLSSSGIKVILVKEDSPSRMALLKHRLKRLGISQVFGQLAFMVFERIALRNLHRIEELEAEYKLRHGVPDDCEVIEVSSVNSVQCIELIQSVSPALIVVNGTRIIAQRVLKCCETPFVNTHVGITPTYRGVHGGYWALANGDTANFGATVHFVDKGVDTGKVISQVKILPSARDNFSSYPTLQYGIVLPELIKAVKRILNGEQVGTHNKKNVSSHQYYHPTLWFYLFKRLVSGV